VREAAVVPGDFRTCHQCDSCWGPRSALARERAFICPECGGDLAIGVYEVPWRHLRIRLL
jgi:predicted RNA-binding Zn-ribbon protein involved in translation (DUF1610 family)